MEVEAPDDEEGTDSKDPDSLGGMMGEFMVCLTRAVNNAQQDEKPYYHCSSPDQIIIDCPLVKLARKEPNLNHKEGMVPKKGAQSVRRATAKVEDDQTPGNTNYSGYHEMVLPKNTETINAFASCVITAKGAMANTSERINVMTLSVQRATAKVEDDQTAGNTNLGGYHEMVLAKNTEIIDAFASCVITAKGAMADTSERIDVMTQTLHMEDGFLLQGLMVQHSYTKLRKGSKNVTIVVRNSMAYPQTLKKKTPVAKAVEVTWVPEPPVQTGLTGAMGEDSSHQMPKLTVEQRQEGLF